MQSDCIFSLYFDKFARTQVRWEGERKAGGRAVPGR